MQPNRRPRDRHRRHLAPHRAPHARRLPQHAAHPRPVAAVLGPLELPFSVVQQDDLGEHDARRACGTPTLLVDSRDLFGVPAPEPPCAAPS